MQSIMSNLTFSGLAFCILAVVIQPVIIFLVYKKQDKDQAALKVPLVFFSVVYLVVQLFVFFKYLIRIPEDYRILSYIIQIIILVVFVTIEMAFLFQNKHVNRIDAQDKQRTALMMEARQEIEIQATLSKNPETKEIIRATAEKVRLADPTGDERTENEERKLIEIIRSLSYAEEEESIREKCIEIEKLLEIRKIRKN